MTTDDHRARADALERLTSANEMIRQGRAELAAANRRIAKAQALIDECTAVIRDTWTRRTEDQSPQPPLPVRFS